MDGQRTAVGFDILQAVVALLFLSAGLPKLVGTWRARAMFDHLRVPQQLLVVVGALEVAVALGLAVGFFRHEISVFAALLACPAMFGAMMTNITRSRRRDAWLPTGMLLFLCALIAFVRWNAESPDATKADQSRASLQIGPEH